MTQVYHSGPPRVRLTRGPQRENVGSTAITLTIA